MNILAILIPVFLSISFGEPNLTQAEIDETIAAHNDWRTKVNTPPLIWDKELAKTALKWAKKLKEKGCAFEHSRISGLGENLFMGTTGFYDPKDVVDAWGNEVEYYNYEDNSCSGVCGHYTQIVWATTKKVGCAKIECNGNDIWVCNYDPPGNWVGQKPY